MCGKIGKFCPECGAGIIAEDDYRITFRLPTDYPFEEPCTTCTQQGSQAMRDLGQEAKKEIDRNYLIELMGLIPP